jgi:predicted PurR-regulated permease PerM
VVSTIDNVLRPLLAGTGVRLPGILLSLGMFGGMAAFGLMGLFLRPIPRERVIVVYTIDIDH